jgi:AraC-like DNA-binding protein
VSVSSDQAATNLCGVYVTAAPRGPLSEFVQSIWLYEGEAPEHARDRRLPTGGVDLIVSLRDHSIYPDVVVSGPFTHAFTLDTAAQRDTLGVAFKVGGAAALLGLPLDALLNVQVPLAELWRSEASELRDRVLAVPTPKARLETAERMLAARLAAVSRPPHPAVGRAVARIEAAPERCRIAELSEMLGLSRRRFAQIFRADIGMTPKAYQRLQRFRRALVRIEDADAGGWAGFALERGYYDQAHLINEFGAHCGLTPPEYRASRARSFVNHVPITG